MTAIEEFVIARTFNAPRDLVWKAHSEQDRLALWWGPKGMALGISKFEFRTGGTFLYSMTAPSGHAMWGKFVYGEIVPGESYEAIVSFTDELGNLVRHPMDPNWPLEMLSTVRLTEENGKTTVTTTATPLRANAAEIASFNNGQKSMQGGFSGTFDQLEAYLLVVQE